MVGIKNMKTTIIGAWLVATIAFFAGLKYFPAWDDAVLRKAFLVLFGYISLMFGLTWKFIWKLTKKGE